jgi:hypothetical protein
LFYLKDRMLSLGGAAFMIAIDAIDRTAGTRFEGDLSFFSALTALDGEKLASSGRRKGGGPILNRSLRPFSGTNRPAGSATLGRMVMPFGLIGLLFFNGENVGGFAIEAYQ